MLPTVTDDMTLPQVAMALRLLIDHLNVALPLDNTEGWADGITNYTTETRELDATTTTLSEVRDYVATMANDLINAGILK